MMNRTGLSCLLTMVVVCAPTAERALGAASFWLSESGDPATGSMPPSTKELVPIISASIGPTRRLFLWARPDQFETLQNFSVRVISSNPDAVKLTGASIAQFNSMPQPNQTIAQRWEHVTEPVGNPSGGVLSDLESYTFFLSNGVGIGQSGGGGQFVDPFYNANTNSWLLGAIDYTVVSIDPSNIYLQIGAKGMNYRFGNSSNLFALFGSLDDPMQNALSERLISAGQPEARIASADFNDDGDVDGGDFLTWQRGFASTAVALRADGDANGDEIIDGRDHATWRSQLGATGSSGIAAPELPAATLAMFPTALFLIGWRRHRS